MPMLNQARKSSTKAGRRDRPGCMFRLELPTVQIWISFESATTRGPFCSIFAPRNSTMLNEGAIESATNSSSRFRGSRIFKEMNPSDPSGISDHRTDAARPAESGKRNDDVDEKDEEIAHLGIVARRETRKIVARTDTNYQFATDTLKATLYEQIGKLQVQLNWLKKESGCRNR